MQRWLPLGYIVGRPNLPSFWSERWPLSCVPLNHRQLLPHPSWLKILGLTVIHPCSFGIQVFFFNLSACYVIIERNTVKEEEIHLNWKISAVSTKFFCLEFAAKTGSIPVANRPNRPVYLYRSLIHWLKMGRRRQRLMKRLAKRIEDKIWIKIYGFYNRRSI